jgi:phosphohistidine phosphatase
MKLYFLRHATATDIAPSDAERALTNEGREEAHIAGVALAKLGAKPAQVFTSPLVRANQTARIAAKEARFTGEIIVLDELKPGKTASALFRALKPHQDAGDLLLVGHMPSLAEHIGVLIGAERTESLALGKGGIACVETEHLKPGDGQLRWLMRQAQLRQIAERQD